jgi:DnaJ-class molecular chaperone
VSRDNSSPPGSFNRSNNTTHDAVRCGRMIVRRAHRKTVTETINLTVDVAKGLRPDEKVTFEKVTDEKPGYVAGDLNFIIVQEPHEVFHRDRDDLYKTMEVPLVDALTGFQFQLVHLDGVEFTVSVNEVTDCDHVMRVPGKGMPRRNGRGYGDLYLTFEVDFPDTLTADQKTAIREILGGSDDDANESESTNEGGNDEL